MRVVIAGCREYSDYKEAERFIGEQLSELSDADKIIILSGGCRGAGQLGERFATEHGYKAEHYPAQWSLYGRAAGPIRNHRMVEACDIVICFWDNVSKGTESLIKLAKAHEKDIRLLHVRIPCVSGGGMIY